MLPIDDRIPVSQDTDEDYEDPIDEQEGTGSGEDDD